MTTENSTPARQCILEQGTPDLPEAPAEAKDAGLFDFGCNGGSPARSCDVQCSNRSKLRGCDLVRLRIDKVFAGGKARDARDCHSEEDWPASAVRIAEQTTLRDRLQLAPEEGLGTFAPIDRRGGRIAASTHWQSSNDVSEQCRRDCDDP